MMDEVEEAKYFENSIQQTANPTKKIISQIEILDSFSKSKL